MLASTVSIAGTNMLRATSICGQRRLVDVMVQRLGITPTCDACNLSTVRLCADISHCSYLQPHVRHPNASTSLIIEGLSRAKGKCVRRELVFIAKAPSRRDTKKVARIHHLGSKVKWHGKRLVNWSIFGNVEYYCGQHFMHDGPDSKHKDILMCSVKASCHRERYHRVTSQSRRWIRRECNHKEARVLGSILVRVNLLVSESRLMTRQSSVTIESWFYTITERITQGSADSPLEPYCHGFAASLADHAHPLDPQSTTPLEVLSQPHRAAI